MMLEILEFTLPVCYVQSSLAIYLRFVNVLADWLTGWLAGWLAVLPAFLPPVPGPHSSFALSLYSIIAMLTAYAHSFRSLLP